MTYSPTKFEAATSNGLGGDAFTRNVTDGRTHRRTDGRRTNFDTKLIYPFFLKKKAGIIMQSRKKEFSYALCIISSFVKHSKMLSARIRMYLVESVVT